MNLLLNLFFLLLGGFIGNRLALGRDQRKEYNEIADPLRTRLRKEWKEVGPNSWIKNEEFRELVDRAFFWEKKGLQKQFKRYREVKADYKQDSIGQPIYQNKKLVQEETEKLIRKIYRK